MDKTIVEKIQEIAHYNRWLTDNIRNYMKNFDNRISFLFKPYEAFIKMSSLFGLSEEYLPEHRKARKAKKIIAESILNDMKVNLKKKVQEWIKQYPKLAELLLEAQIGIISFIDDYINKFDPKPTSHYQMYIHHPNFNRNYFSEITTIEQAYWLGFLFADGYVSLERKNYGDYYRMGLALAEKDKEVIVEFCKAVGLNPKYNKPYMSYSSFTNKYHPMRKIRWGDQDFAQDLIKLGMEYEYDDEKGTRVKTPKLPDLGSQELMLAFLLGFYDGDGSLGLTTNKKGKETFKPYIHSSQKEFLLQIKNYFKIKSSVYLSKSKSYDYKREVIFRKNSYRLYLGVILFEEMLINLGSSLKRKRVDLEYFEKVDKSRRPQNRRQWLMQVLPKEVLRQMLEVLSPFLIGEILGASGKTIVKIAEEVYGIRRMDSGHYKSIRTLLHYHGEASQYYEDFNYWLEYLGKIKKSQK